MIKKFIIRRFKISDSELEEIKILANIKDKNERTLALSAHEAKSKNFKLAYIFYSIFTRHKNLVVFGTLIILLQLYIFIKRVFL